MKQAGQDQKHSPSLPALLPKPCPVRQVVCGETCRIQPGDGRSSSAGSTLEGKGNIRARRRAAFVDLPVLGRSVGPLRAPLCPEPGARPTAPGPCVGCVEAVGFPMFRRAGTRSDVTGDQQYHLEISRGNDAFGCEAERACSYVLSMVYNIEIKHTRDETDGITQNNIIEEEGCVNIIPLFSLPRVSYIRFCMHKSARAVRICTIHKGYPVLP